MVEEREGLALVVREERPSAYVELLLFAKMRLIRPISDRPPISTMQALSPRHASPWAQPTEREAAHTHQDIHAA